MRLCVSIPCFFPKTDFCEALRKIAALGYDAAETWSWKGLDVEEVARTCRETGVELMSMCTSEFRMTDPAFRGAWLEGLRESCETAKKIGVKKLITQVGPDTGAPREKQHEAIVTTLRAAAPILDESGVTVMIEPLNTYVDHKGYYLWSSREAFEIVKEADHPLVKVVYDIYHQQVMEGNIIPSVTGNLDVIAHLHAGGHPGRHELQRGETDYKVVFAAIDAAGYKGACGLEYLPKDEPAQSLADAKRIYG